MGASGAIVFGGGGGAGANGSGNLYQNGVCGDQYCNFSPCNSSDTLCTSSGVGGNGATGIVWIWS